MRATCEKGSGPAPGNGGDTIVIRYGTDCSMRRRLSFHAGASCAPLCAALCRSVPLASRSVTFCAVLCRFVMFCAVLCSSVPFVCRSAPFYAVLGSKPKLGKSPSEEELERPVDLLESLAWLTLTKQEYLSSQLGPIVPPGVDSAPSPTFWISCVFEKPSIAFFCDIISGRLEHLERPLLQVNLPRTQL